MKRPGITSIFLIFIAGLTIITGIYLYLCDCHQEQPMQKTAVTTQVSIEVPESAYTDLDTLKQRLAAAQKKAIESANPPAPPVSSPHDIEIEVEASDDNSSQASMPERDTTLLEHVKNQAVYHLVDQAGDLNYEYIAKSIEYLEKDALPSAVMPYICWDAVPDYYHEGDEIERQGITYYCNLLGAENGMPMFYWETQFSSTDHIQESE